MLKKGLGKFLGRMLLQLFNLASKPILAIGLGFFLSAYWCKSDVSHSVKKEFLET